MKLLIADDHTLFRDALVQYIKRAYSDAEIIVTENFTKAYERIQESSDFDLVVLDLRMPGMKGIESFEQVREEFPSVKVALMSGVAEPEDVKAAMAAGACAYFPKTMSGKALVSAIDNVLRGEQFMPIEPGTGKTMPSYYSDEKRTNVSYGGLAEIQEGIDEDVKLTPREKEVLSYLAKGATNKDIANALGLQIVTIKLHVRGICQKLQVSNRTQAALKATTMGLAGDAGHTV